VLPYFNGQISEDIMTEPHPLREAVAELAEHFGMTATLMDGFEDAIIGTTMTNHELRVIYSYDKMIDVLMVRDGMTEDEASEFIGYNCQTSFDGCPLIMDEIKL